jgi:hypothetical protein
MFELPITLLSMVLEFATAWTVLLMKKNDDDTDPELSHDTNDDLGSSALSCDIKENNVDNQQQVLHLDQACSDITIRTTRVPLPKKRSCAETVIARTPLSNL